MISPQDGMGSIYFAVFLADAFVVIAVGTSRQAHFRPSFITHPPLMSAFTIHSHCLAYTVRYRHGPYWDLQASCYVLPSMQVPPHCLAAGLPDCCTPMWSNSSVVYYDSDMIPTMPHPWRHNVHLKVHEAVASPCIGITAAALSRRAAGYGAGNQCESEPR